MLGLREVVPSSTCWGTPVALLWCTSSFLWLQRSRAQQVVHICSSIRPSTRDKAPFASSEEVFSILAVSTSHLSQDLHGLKGCIQARPGQTTRIREQLQLSLVRTADVDRDQLIQGPALAQRLRPHRPWPDSGDLLRRHDEVPSHRLSPPRGQTCANQGAIKSDLTL
ncbi:hypothetical protein BDZ85DRAFT_79649 [Elsinoe ampelina]|uniref:Uncharacterized protein n=1 Tax=Elsinoe ampelina TaxID=302913 RepID=A0A6A6FYP3_9PEZI|nr:hypothetical protein BDZ85DRAFT_79649 [Elsinoe ampelina]